MQKILAVRWTLPSCITVEARGIQTDDLMKTVVAIASPRHRPAKQRTVSATLAARNVLGVAAAYAAGYRSFRAGRSHRSVAMNSASGIRRR